MNFQHYRQSDLELWISKIYQENGIQYASDINIERIAGIFQIDLRYYSGQPFAHWDDESGEAYIFLNSYMTESQRRESFFHELCHPLQHAGCQNNMPPLFKELQEIQAAHFQLYASMPLFMLEEFWSVSPSVLIKILSEEFQLSEAFVIRRFEQIQARIRGVEWMLNIPPRRPRLDPNIAYEKDHIRQVIFELHRIQQLRRQKGQAHG
jgi:Zn-dependent peptidase ImmA (M78 family)